MQDAKEDLAAVKKKAAEEKVEAAEEKVSAASEAQKKADDDGSAVEKKAAAWHVPISSTCRSPLCEPVKGDAEDTIDTGE